MRHRCSRNETLHDPFFVQHCDFCARNTPKINVKETWKHPHNLNTSRNAISFRVYLHFFLGFKNIWKWSKRSTFFLCFQSPGFCLLPVHCLHEEAHWLCVMATKVSSQPFQGAKVPKGAQVATKKMENARYLWDVIMGMTWLRWKPVTSPSSLICPSFWFGNRWLSFCGAVINNEAPPPKKTYVYDIPWKFTWTTSNVQKNHMGGGENIYIYICSRLGFHTFLCLFRGWSSTSETYDREQYATAIYGAWLVQVDRPFVWRCWRRSLWQSWSFPGNLELFRLTWSLGFSPSCGEFLVWWMVQWKNAMLKLMTK